MSWTLDLRPKLPPIINQGNQSICVAAALVCVMEYLKSYYPFSIQFLNDMGGETNLTGLLITVALDVLVEFGICRESTYPTTNHPQGRSDIPIEAAIEALQWRLQSYTLLTTVAQVQEALALGPVPFLIAVFNHSDQPWTRQHDEDILGFHALAFVGYGPEGFLVRNSWGEHWGEHGYTTLAYRDWQLLNQVYQCIDRPSPSIPLDPSKHKHNDSACLLT